MVDQYAVIGHPIAQSRSPEIHTAFAKQLGQQISYVRIEAPLHDFVGAVEAFRAGGGQGVNVTAPFKLDAYAFADRRSVRAQVAGAANTLSFDADNDAVFADNTDGVGLVRDIRSNIGLVIRDKRVLILGAGGAVRGVLAALANEAPVVLAVANRSPDKAHRLVAELSPGLGHRQALVVEVSALADHQYDLVINATSASLFDTVPQVPPSCFATGCLAYDMVYGRGLTPFLDVARQTGARAVDGVGMLVEQAAEAFWLWRKERPDTKPVIAALQIPL